MAPAALSFEVVVLQNPRRRRWGVALLGLIATCAVVVAAMFLRRPDDAAQLNRARAALSRRDYAQAEALAVAVGQRPQSDPWAWMIAGEAAARTGRLSDSLGYYERITGGGADLRSAGAYGRGEICLQLGRLERAEREFRAALDADPQSLLAHRRLVDVCNLSGRRHLAVSSMQRLIQSPAIKLEDLLYLGDVDHALLQPDEVRAAIGDPQADPLLLLGLGYEALAENRGEEARKLFERVLQHRPADVDAEAGLGQALWLAAPEELPAWRSQLSTAVTDDAGVQSVLGQLAERENRPEDAVGHFARTVAGRPTSRIAWYRLGLCLSRLGRTADAERALERAQQLQQVGLWLDDLFEHRRQFDLVRRVAVQLATHGRIAEAAAWSQYALSSPPQATWARPLLAQLEQAPHSVVDVNREQALAELLRGLTTARPSARDVGASQLVGRDLQSMVVIVDSRIRFVDDASTAGLHFVYHSARDADTPGARILETTGGGVGVLDYDADGWPDLYFTQGSRTLPSPEPNPDRDRLFRNRQGQAWDDVSAQVGIEDVGFGQGVAVGDFDNDGFADLYVANYGVNRLFQNQGDGTFRDVTPAAMRSQPVWTSSGVIVDVNADGWPDLFDVTYCRGDDVATRICEKQGQPRSCSPRAFAAETDRLWLNTGDGGWRLAADCGLELPDGLGLGVIAFRPSPDQPLGLFVANDETPNYWLVNTQRSTGSPPQWQDQALLGGLAVDADGKPQACMGVACDDANGDGLPDLFVTNFYQESNTLYSAVTPEFYEDRTRVAGLREPSWNMLGFGTQFLDADLDGWPDLLVANGHIDDLTASGQPFAMPLQGFRNRGGTFRELTPAEAGECFARPGLGRGMARLDWNRDGRDDAVIVNQDSPAVLLTNVSDSPGHALILRFQATRGARDAIGTIVRVRLGERRLTRQLTAGDGYQASNERQLVIGVGAADRIEGLEVFWPDGSRGEYGPIATGMPYLILQNRAEAIAWGGAK
ncbi:MAG TPA: FG-GAP-like repeat-containing protein [Planctomycetaceae bacterium]|nr:FG-GAP-like repeat-containing protein [Planctomycetaceae bacterium]